jgi:hypothetical protein
MDGMRGLTGERETQVEEEQIRLVNSPAYGLRCATAAAMFTLVLAISAMAQQPRMYREGGVWVEESGGSLPPAANLTVRMDIGNVIVQGGNDPQISYTLKKRVRADSRAEAQKRFEQFRFSAGKQGATDALTGGVNGSPQSLNEDLLVQVPRGMHLVNVAVVHGGNESVSGLDGRAQLWTSAGNVRVDDIGGSVKAISGAGNFEAGRMGGDLLVNTGGGYVHVNSVQGNLVASTGGGNVSIGSAAHAISIRTGGGSIDVKQCAGKVNAVTGGGIIRLSSAEGPVTVNSAAGALQLFGLTHGANVQTGSGGIVAEFLGGDFAASSLQTQNGDIIVYLASGVKASVEAEVDMANGHHVRSEFPEIVVTRPGDPSSQRSLRAGGKLQGGGPLLSVRAMSGDIEFRRAQR